MTPPPAGEQGEESADIPVADLVAEVRAREKRGRRGRRRGGGKQSTISWLLNAALCIHAVAWVGVSVLLVLINALTLFLPPWCIFPIFGWGT